MHPRNHVIVSSLLALTFTAQRHSFPWLAWSASILADADHYLWYAVRWRRLNPESAYRHFAADDVTEGPVAPLLLHHPLTLALVAGLGWRYRPLRQVAWGLAFHRLVDDGSTLWQEVHRLRRRRHWRRMQDIVFAREQYSCQGCGRTDGPLELHHVISEAAGGKTVPTNLVALCPACHDRAHEKMQRSAHHGCAAASPPTSRPGSSICILPPG